MKRLHSSVVNGAPTLEQVGAANLPSLAGYWKCSDATSMIVPDHSSNGLDLTLTCTEEDSPIGSNDCPAGGISFVNGHLTLSSNFACLVDVAGTPIDTLTNHVIWGCELYIDGVSDYDMGTAWAGGHEPSDAANFTGFQIGGFGTAINAARIIWNDGSQENLIAGVCEAPGDNSSVVYAAGFRPSTSLASAYSVNSATPVFDVDSTPSGGTIPASIVAQNGKFGLRSTSQTAQMTPVRNFYVWSFSSEPDYMNETITWLAANPGKIPPWWIGR